MPVVDALYLFGPKLSQVYGLPPRELRGMTLRELFRYLEWAAPKDQ